MIEITKITLSSDLGGYAVTPIDSFIDALTTPKGSVIARPAYGTKLYTLKHRPYNSSWLIDFKRCLKDACSFDDRLKFKEAIISENEISVGKLNFDVSLENSIIQGFINV